MLHLIYKVVSKYLHSSIAKPVSYMPSLKAAEYCLDFLMEYPTPLDKNVFKLSTDLGIMKGWLQEIEQGEVS